jgi:hypothetical protein
MQRALRSSAGPDRAVWARMGRNAARVPVRPIPQPHQARTSTTCDRHALVASGPTAGSHILVQDMNMTDERLRLEQAFELPVELGFSADIEVRCRAPSAAGMAGSLPNGFFRDASMTRYSSSHGLLPAAADSRVPVLAPRDAGVARRCFTAIRRQAWPLDHRHRR